MSDTYEDKPSIDTAADRFLQQFTGYRVKRALLVIHEDMAEKLAPLGLRVGTFSPLAVIAANPGISQTRLSDVLHIKRSGVVAVVDELERMGAIERKPVKGDRRTNALSMTAAGRKLWEAAEGVIQAHEDHLFAGLSNQENEQLRNLLTRVTQSATQAKE
ncbi:MarR family winged helix-turn-helix transcriptional regulator [Yoonia maritima]|uniref:MarR family winged helix-turn-helix transcriptional regulator n=1 Tax=Yoonia maritima TaxID=1435347 RepID=UPI0037354328